MEAVDRLARFPTDLVLSRQGAEQATVGDDVQHRPAISRPAIGRRPERFRHAQPGIGEQAWTADLHVAPINHRSRTHAGASLEASRHRYLDSSVVCRPCDRPCQRMLRVRLDRCGQRQQRRLLRTGRCAHAGNHRGPAGQGACLVEDHEVHVPRALERHPISHQETVLRSEGRTDRDHQGNRQPQGVGTGDHQDGRSAD